MEMESRKANRMREYDYSRPGHYFVTICVQGRKELFGEIIDDRMMPNAAGEMVEETWRGLPKYYQGIQMDEFQAMPNHVHGIIVITGSEFHHRTVADRSRPVRVLATLQKDRHGGLSLQTRSPPMKTKDNHGGQDRRKNHEGFPLRCRTSFMGSNRGRPISIWRASGRMDGNPLRGNCGSARFTTMLFATKKV
ncbi:MAG: hypothetical protein OXL41_01010 [Nitrospinae bacterium]|nr:hypothetical protein [Nitrospinota bacterium]